MAGTVAVQFSGRALPRRALRPSRSSIRRSAVCESGEILMPAKYCESTTKVIRRPTRTVWVRPPLVDWLIHRYAAF